MSRLLLALIICCSIVQGWAAPGNTVTAGKGRPNLFMENRGQIHGPDDKPLPQVLYHLAGRGINVSLMAQSIHYTFIKQIENGTTGSVENSVLKGSLIPAEYETVGMDVALVSANPVPKITAEEQQEYYENYYTSAVRKQGGITNVHSYARIVYHDIYPSIDWIVYVPEHAAGSSVKYDFVVHPGGNSADIKLKYNGVTALSLKSDGGLTAQTELGELHEGRPYSYVKENGAEVASRYILRGDTLSYALGKPVAGTLVIDPQVVWATYFGGNSGENSYCVAAYKGDAYIGGVTGSTSNIATLGSFKVFSFGGDAYLAKFSSSGSLLWATYFGGSGIDVGEALALDTSAALASIYLCGQTTSTDSIATSGSHQTSYNGGNRDGFIAKFTTGGALVRATYYGGADADLIYAAACDAQGNLYVGGFTGSTTGIATSGTPGGNGLSIPSDGFVAKFNSGGVRQWGQYFGGEAQDWVSGLYAFPSGGIVITGTTTSSTGISTLNSYQPAKRDSMDAFIARLNASGNVMWSTYFGGDNLESGMDVTADDTGAIYACGLTSSQSNISTPGSHQSGFAGNTDGYIAKFNAIGGLLWSSYYGGSGNEYSLVWGNYLAGDRGMWSVCFTHGKLWLTGATNSRDGIAMPNCYQDSLSGSALPQTLDAFVATFDMSGNRLWATYFGGSGWEYDNSIACDNLGNVYVAGSTGSSADIAVNHPYQPSLNGSSDAFLLRIFDSVSTLRVRNVRPYCINDTFSLGNYITANGTLRTGNIFKVELSNASGSFSTPTVIGTLTSPAAGSVFCTLPTGISGSGYKLRMVSTRPVMISDTVTINISAAVPVPVITRSGSTLGTGAFAGYQWYKNGVAIPGATSATYKPTANGQYTVAVTSAGGCKGTSVVYNMTGVGVAGLALSDIKIYPNPTYDYLTIEGAGQGTGLVITTLIGQQIMGLTINAARQIVPVAQLPAGIYILTLSDSDGGKKMIKMVKQ